MKRISDHYRLSGRLPFVDLHVDRDNKLFLDPSAIRNNRRADPRAHRAHELLIGFFQDVLRRRASTAVADQVDGLALLQQLHEPNETRLGMSANGVAGHGFGEGLGDRLWDQLLRNPACQDAALTRLEDLALFVDGVGDDLVSDLTTRVVFEVLVDFTRDMITRFPSLAVGATTEAVQVWDPNRMAWTTRVVELPHVAGRQLLLVPKQWVYWRVLMDPNAFYNHFGTATVQQERTSFRGGRRYAPPKWFLKEEFPDVKALNRQQAAKYKREGDDLVARYRDMVDHAYVPLGDAELVRRTT